MQEQDESSFSDDYYKETLKPKTVKSVKHINIVLKNLFSFCEDRHFSDICLISSDKVKFYTHKCVLSASSDFFMKKIKDYPKTGGRKTELKFDEIESKILEQVLSFIYTGIIEFQSETVESIVEAAIFFQIISLIEECFTYMEGQLHVRNCLDMITWAEQNNFMDFHEKALKFSSANFEVLQKRQKYLELEENLLCLIISNKELCVQSEETVFLSVIKWIDYDQTNRKKSAYNLFSKVRYWLLSLNFIKQHRSNLQMYQLECLELVCIWMEWHISPSDNCELKSIIPFKAKKSNELALISCEQQLIYDAELNKWTDGEKIPEMPNYFSSAIVLNNKIIFQMYFQRLLCVDLDEKKSKKLPELYLNRCRYKLAVLNNMLYVIGGHILNREYRWKRYVDRYNFSSGSWEKVTPMKNQFSFPKVAVAGGLLYVVGKEGVMECFNPNSNKWIIKPFINKTISDFSFIGVNEILYVVGGLVNNITSDILYSYDPDLEQWERETNMILGLSKSKCTSWNNQLIVFGGYDSGKKFQNIIQKFNPESKIWTELASPDHFKNSTYQAILNI